MKRPNFFHWYYNQGVWELLEIWKNFLLFVLRYFSIFELLKTLVYPWHRDVSVQNWRGLHPFRTFELVLENIISRAIGTVVRLITIFAGVLFLASVAITGLVINFLWISAPLIFLFLLIYATRGLANIFIAGIFILGWVLFSVYCYFHDNEVPAVKIGPDEFIKQKVFERICGRFGIDSKRFPNGIFESEKKFEDFLKARSLTRDDYTEILKWEILDEEKKSNSRKFWHWENLKSIRPIGSQWRYGYTVNLDRYCKDLSESDWTAYGTAELIGRDNEYEVLKLLLERPDQNCALIVGNAGIGKKTLIHSLARRIRTAKESELENVRVMLFDLGQAISDALNRGEDVENFLRMIFFEASYAGNVILVVEHLEQFVGKNASIFHPDVSAVLAEFLDIPSFQLIATSTVKEYHNLIERQEQLVKYFEVIELREPSEKEAVKILLSSLEKYESKRILFTFRALKEIVSSSGKYNWEVPLPERALDLAMDTLMFWEKKSKEQFISEKTVADYLTLKTGIQHGEIEANERKKLLNLEKVLHRQVIGQEEAIKQVSEALRRARSGINNSKKPIGSFLFLGPTGVGKTETAKALAKAYFGDESRMIRFDMSEFQMPNSIDRLLGSSNLNQQGRLAMQVKDNPYSLILLDEIEKAYPEIMDIFLQILDEGFVTDAFGEKINFTNTMIIATSNAGAALIKKMVENNIPAEEIKQAVIDYAIEKNIFRTEFLNRFDGVIFFRPLTYNELRSVVQIKLRQFSKQVAKEKNIEITFAENISDNIIQKGYNPIFGARSINRYIEDTVEGIVARKIISGEAKNGDKITINL